MSDEIAQSDKLYDLDKISSEMVEFIDSFKSVIISSDLGEHCIVSYAPFVREGDEIYILLSSIARHYQGIKHDPNKVQIIFLQDETLANSIFERKRVAFSTKADILLDKNEFISKFENKFSDEVQFLMIKQMEDFHIIRLKIGQGRFVKYAGVCFETDGLKVLKQLNEYLPHKIFANKD